MRVFVTGATGFIGSAVVKELIGAGHQVIGLARTDKGAAALAQMGAEVQRGSLEDLESLRQGAAQADGVIHLGFVHDLSHMSLSKRIRLFVGALTKGIVQSFGGTIVGIDAQAIEAIGAQLAGTQRPFVTVLGTLSLMPGKMGTEQDDIDPSSFGGMRGNSEKAMLALVSKGIRAIVIRLPPTVHGDGDKGFVPLMIKAAKKQGVSAFINNGQNRWPAVHRLDAAHLLRLALEKGTAGARYHAVADEGIEIKNIATVIGNQLNLPVASKSGKSASRHFSWLSLPLSVDNPASSKWTQQQLGWQPKNADLITDLEKGTYFVK